MKILITGANRGLGYILARTAAEQGHTVIAGFKSSARRMDLLESLCKDYHERIHTVNLDVTDEHIIAQAAAEISESHASLDVIINNAAILLSRETWIEQLDFTDIRACLEVNTLGPMRVVKYFLPLLYKGTNQALINISSAAGSFHNAYGGDFPYALSKAALTFFSQQMHKALSDRGILVCAVDPGWMRTDMGGDYASLDPYTSSRGIMDIINRKIQINGPFMFVDYLGNVVPV